MEKLCNLNKVRFPQTGYLIQVFFCFEILAFSKENNVNCQKIALFFKMILAHKCQVGQINSMLTPLNTFDINAFFKHFPKKETIFNSNENKILFQARKKLVKIKFIPQWRHFTESLNLFYTFFCSIVNFLLSRKSANSKSD